MQPPFTAGEKAFQQGKGPPLWRTLPFRQLFKGGTAAQSSLRPVQAPPLWPPERRFAMQFSKSEGLSCYAVHFGENAAVISRAFSSHLCLFGFGQEAKQLRAIGKEVALKVSKNLFTKAAKPVLKLIRTGSYSDLF